MLRRPALYHIAFCLRHNKATLSDYLQQVCAHARKISPALLPESGMETRLREEAGLLESGYTHRRAQERPLLYSIPVVVKDVFYVKGLEERSYWLRPARESAVITRLRNEGALILAKAAPFPGNLEALPWNVPQVPYMPGGTAAAVAAGLSPLGVSTQTTRSVIGAAGLYGIIGLKTSYGRIPVNDIHGLAPSIDTLGLFTHDIDGIHLAMKAMCPRWLPPPASPRPVLGVPEGLLLQFLTPDVKALYELHLLQLKQCGITVCKVPLLPADYLQDAFRLGQQLLLAEGARSYRDCYGPFSFLFQGPQLQVMENGWRVQPAVIQQARQRQLELREKITDCMQAHGINAWVLPAFSGHHLDDTRYFKSAFVNSTTAIWSLAGLPAISIPCRQPQGTAMQGLQLVGQYGKDESLVGIAARLSHLLVG